jgi:hypothetical protein
MSNATARRCRGARLCALAGGAWNLGRIAMRPYTRADDAASHMGVFGEGSGEGVSAKTPSPETSSLFALLSALCDR